MNTGNITLTPADKQLLNSYCHLLDGLSSYLGDGYEMVLHSLEDYEHSAIKVINGYHTGRTEGAPITNMALSLLAQMHDGDTAENGITYFSKNAKNEPLKSTTLPIRGEHNRIIGLLCINFYLNTPFSDILQTFQPASYNTPGSPATEIHENFSQTTGDLLEETIQKTRQEVLMDSSVSSSNKNKEIIRLLYQQGIFNLKDSVQITSQELNLSKNTVYLHLRNLEKGN